MKHAEYLDAIFRLATQLASSLKADAVMLVAEDRLPWTQVRTLMAGGKLLIAADSEEIQSEVEDFGFTAVTIGMPDAPVFDKIGQALIRFVAEEMLPPVAKVVCIYSGLEPDLIDSVSVVDLGEHMGRLTIRDLRRLETSVPLDIVQTVVTLALEIGREGREGKPVGTLFVVGDTRKVLANSHPTGFDPVKGYSRKERNLKSSRVREGIKEIAQMDGAIIVSADGTVEAAARYIDARAGNLTLAKGLGARHWAAAAITRMTKAIAVVVSESSGTVRIFQDGEVVMRVEPFRRAMVWRDFDHELEPRNNA